MHINDQFVHAHQPPPLVYESNVPSSSATELHVTITSTTITSINPSVAARSSINCRGKKKTTTCN